MHVHKQLSTISENSTNFNISTKISPGKSFIEKVIAALRRLNKIKYVFDFDEFDLFWFFNFQAVEQNKTETS